MAKFNTGNPLGSVDPRDLFDNATIADHYVDDTDNESWPDRFGRARRTWHGIEIDSSRQLSSQEDRFQQFLLNSGYVILPDYIDGPVTFTARNQVTAYKGEFYRPKASVSLPYTTTGTTDATWELDKDNFVTVVDAALRQEISTSDGLKLIGSVDSFQNLSLFAPDGLGQLINLKSFYSMSSWAAEGEKYTGGGIFISVPKVSADGGYISDSGSSDYSWKRVIEDGRLYATMFGAKPDYDAINNVSATDSTNAFNLCQQSCVANDLEHNIPAGDWYLTGNGVDLNGSYTITAGEQLPRDKWNNVILGAPIYGAGSLKTKIYFNPSTQDSSCFAIRGGWGTISNRHIKGLSILPIIANDNQDYTSDTNGVGIELQGCGFSEIDDVYIGRFHRGYWFNNRDSGDYTEFNKITNSHVYQCDINYDFSRTNGNDSFHGNQINSTSQLRATGGIGLRLKGIDTSKMVNLYNAIINLKMYGGDNAPYAIYLQYGLGHFLTGSLTTEGKVTLYSGDTSSYWQMDGAFWNQSAVSVNLNGGKGYSYAQGHAFMFSNNALPNQYNFSGANGGLGVNQYFQRPYNAYANFKSPLFGTYAGTDASGVYTWGPLITSGTTDTGGGLMLAYVPASGLIIDAIPYMRFTRGGSIVSYADSTYLKNNKRTMSLTSGSLAFETDNAVSIGLASLRCSTGYFANGTQTTSDATLKTDPRDVNASEIKAFYEIYQLPTVWQWLAKYQSEGDNARLHNGPTVQAAIQVMTDNGLDWKNYACFCYDEWGSSDEIKDEDGIVVKPAMEAGSIYSFRKEELLSWVLRSVVSKQNDIELRLTKLES